MKERAFRKLDLKIDRFEEFNIPTVQLTNEQMEKFDKFRFEYLNILRKCPRCKYYVHMLNVYCTDDYEFRGLCTECMEYVTDTSKDFKEFAKWFDDILQSKYGMTFKDGFPKLLKHEVQGKYCVNCKAHHTTMQYVDLRDND